uniref:Cell division protein ZapA n=1 Tax=Candidatus Kentrum sp. LFY TaxID=2126342 RepID=A0A450WUK4_9GAMM|nr:MAG: cell division protein ZapA [Candidatus Kentron sp. LFY]VFK01173.1 MAG: cell division protein ZapA [Candidatus Kentron sp. LFY]VFK20638.1 MAG: cell division protein ZapA [Candidatus Kentron sp. LFY]
MNKDKVPVNIQILDKEYVISCPAEEHKDLIASARLLDDRMRQTRDVAKVYGTERILVMSALNIVHELLRMRHDQENKAALLSRSIAQLVEKIDTALAKNQYPPAKDGE